ncbi:MAG: hypothetical protein PHV78_00615 [Patescibacteria group bacterium]|nr:hypothetical protein [Patescibacteria group bacterium]MDD5395756.1 hypothetical protein [Patescibacteria group bacterium]
MKHLMNISITKKVSRHLIAVSLLIMIFLAIAPVLTSYAQVEELERTACTAEICGQTDLAIIVGRIVRIVLGFLGLIAVVIIIIGGFQWMTSGGNEEKITKAKSLMMNGVIGLFIILISYALAMFVLSRIKYVVAPTP